ncbi:hypothetical protein CROQUDRAFT_87121 [Cronartium quercuum f. sp. fusiforme G11]|uniref:Uncharacterized protein n=1 Tax=Cronartium quercuum f. sp. fusiforme G11 TaxID=708437 RepID=A0A9P6TGH8_9BASI|nr:hypothetical protein CROQUDRAFT_87121 [Cronartium quercuum f. sp. fusiforme G11]
MVIANDRMRIGSMHEVRRPDKSKNQSNPVVLQLGKDEAGTRVENAIGWCIAQIDTVRPKPVQKAQYTKFKSIIARKLFARGNKLYRLTSDYKETKKRGQREEKEINGNEADEYSSLILPCLPEHTYLNAMWNFTSLNAVKCPRWLNVTPCSAEILKIKKSLNSFNSFADVEPDEVMMVRPSGVGHVI